MSGPAIAFGLIVAAAILRGGLDAIARQWAAMNDLTIRELRGDFDQ